MDLVCYGPSTVNLDAFNTPTTVYVLYTLFIYVFLHLFWLSDHYANKSCVYIISSLL